MDFGRPSPLGLIILGMLIEEPMHAYRMQKLIRDRGKDTVVNVRQRTSVHQSLDRLLRLGLISVLETAQSDGGPDRTIYKITAQGRRAAKEWLRKILTNVGEEFPEFPAGLSVITLFTPSQAREELEKRAESIRVELSKLDAAKQAAGGLPRVFLLEDEYRNDILSAELNWLERTIAELQNGALTWDLSWLKKIAAEFERPETDEPNRPSPAPRSARRRPK
jgi:DNA-binding PadR family transcriptional regulator